MSKSDAFEKHTAAYEQWFEQHRLVYEAEVRAVRSLLPTGLSGLEIGAGSGRFAAPAGVRWGIEPSRRMRSLALQRGVKVLGGVAEHLPFRAAAFDWALMVTTICFLDDVPRALREAQRVIAAEGFLVIAFVDRSSPLGREYLRHKDNNVFYRQATFYSVDEVLEAMGKAGFDEFECCQTIFNELSQITAQEPVRPGYGRGSFVVVRGRKPAAVDR